MCERKVGLAFTAIGILLLSSVRVFAQMSGSYTVGDGGDYTTISDAIGDVNSQGLSGDVTLTISAGTYAERIDLSNLNNGSFMVTLEGDVENTIIFPTYEDVSAFTGINIEDTDNITIRNLTIDMPVESRGTQIGIYVHDASNISLEGNMISSLTGISIEDATNIEVLSNIVDAERVAFGARKCNTLDVIHNTLHSDQDGFRNYKASEDFTVITEAVLVFDGVVQNVNVINNIFSGVVSEDDDGNAAISFGVGGSFISTSSVINLTSDYNLFDADLGMAVVGLEGISSLDNEALIGDLSLDDWDAMGYDTYSTSFSPDFIDNTNFRARNEDFRFGTYLSEFSTDIDGETRIEGSVDVGADQYCISIENTEEVTACHSYEFAGLTLIESGEYLGRFVAMNGCDSLVTLNLTILGPSMGSDDVTAEGSYDWNGTIYSESGSYEQTLTDQLGCDSIATLNLTIEPYFLEGNFIIGSSEDADFENFTQAIADLQYATLAGDVEYFVETGTYNDTLKLSNINTGEYSLVFSGDDKATTILHPLDSIDESKSGILIDGTNNVTIQNLTLEMDDISSVSVSSSDTKGISIVDADNITLDNLELKNGSETSDFSSSRFFIISGLSLKNVNEVTVTNSTFGGARSHITLSDHTNVIIEENLFQSPRLGILGTETGRNLSIAYNDFIGPFGFAMELSEVEDLSIRSNDFDGVDNEESWGAITLSETTSTLIQDNFIENVEEGIAFDKDSAVIVQQNRVMLSSSFALEADRTDDLTIANNFFGDVIVLERQSNLDFIHNTVVASSSYERDEVVFFEVYIVANEELTVRFSNNIIVGGEQVTDRLIAIVEVNRNEDYSLNLTMDHNLYYLDDESGSKPLVTYEVDVDEDNTEETPYATLTAWRDAFSFDQYSQSFAPSFVSEDDFHVSSSSDYRFGTFLSEYAIDIDGDIRKEGAVDVGADQNYQANYWTGAVDHSWFDDGNWSSGIPTETDNVVIPETSNDPIVNTFDASVYDLRIEEGATLTIDPDREAAVFGTAYGEGAAIVQREGVGNAGYDLVGSPVVDFQVEDLTADFIYGYDGENFVVLSGSMVEGGGYFLAYNEADPVIEYQGVLNSGHITHTYAVDETDQFRLLANPYAAAIPWAGFTDANPDVFGKTIYMWRDGGYNDGAERGGSYITVSAAGVTGNDGSYQGEIPSGEGFFVYVAEEGDVTFSPEIQNSVPANTRVTDETPQTIRLSLSNEANSDDLLIVFTEDATSGLDHGLDARKLRNPAISFFSMIEEQEMAIQALANIDVADTVDLGFAVSEVGEYTLNLEEMNVDGLAVLLYDTETGTTYSFGEGSVSMMMNEAEKMNRFQLILSAINTVLSEQITPSDLRLFGNESQLNLFGSFDGLQEVMIHDLSGRITYKEWVRFEDGRASLEIDLNRDEIYVLRINNETRKFILK